MTDKKRVGWIDAAKGLAILAVILGHSYLYGNPIHAISYSFNVPLFFILAGYTFRPKPFKQNLATSAKRLLLPYVGLCLFLIIVDTLRSPDKSSTLASHLLATFFASGGVIEQGNIHLVVQKTVHLQHIVPLHRSILPDSLLQQLANFTRIELHSYQLRN